MKKFFTLIAAAMMAVGGAMAQTQTIHWEYDGAAVGEGSGYKVEKPELTMTLMMGEGASDLTWKIGEVKASAKDLAGNEIDYTHYVAANGANGRDNIFGNTNCAYFQFEPKYSGTIQVMAQDMGTNKGIIAADITDGTQVNLPTQLYINGELKNFEAKQTLEDQGITDKYTGYVNFKVEGGKKYLYCVSGSKGRLLGYSYTYDSTGTGIADINADVNDANAPVYNLAGQRVNANAKGLVIKNGKKYVNK